MAKEIFVHSQEELDNISTEDDVIINICFGIKEKPARIYKEYNSSVIACRNSSVKACRNSSVIAYGNSSVEAYDNSSVEAYDNSSVIAYGNSLVEAYDNSSVIAYGNSSVEAYGNSSVIAYDNSSVKACRNSSVIAYDNSSVIAYDNSSVIACRNSSVKACRNSSVEAYDNSSVIAYDNSSVIAYDNSSVKAYGNSSVKACRNSSVEAYGNSSVKAYDNVQVLKMSNHQDRINFFGNARIVYMPEKIIDFIKYYNIDHDDTYAIFYKAVHKKIITTHIKYSSDFDPDFTYEIGKKNHIDFCDQNPNETCGEGIHISTKDFALRFGAHWNDLAILEVKAKIKDVILPYFSNGKVRVPEVEILREVPLEECGLLGKAILRRNEMKKENDQNE